MKHVYDGWHTIQGFEIYVEDDKVKRGISGDGVTAKPTYPYRYNKQMNCWVNCSGLSVSAFKSGVRRGTVTMK